MSLRSGCCGMEAIAGCAYVCKPSFEGFSPVSADAALWYESHQQRPSNPKGYRADARPKHVSRLEGPQHDFDSAAVAEESQDAIPACSGGHRQSRDQE